MLKKKFDQAELILEQSVKKGYRHSDLDYLLGETKRLKGEIF